jgi:hypothetical protein
MKFKLWQTGCKGFYTAEITDRRIECQGLDSGEYAQRLINSGRYYKVEVLETGEIYEKIEEDE